MTNNEMRRLFGADVAFVLFEAPRAGRPMIARRGRMTTAAELFRDLPGDSRAAAPARSRHEAQSLGADETNDKRKRKTDARIAAARERLRRRGVDHPSVNAIAREADVRWETVAKRIN